MDPFASSHMPVNAITFTSTKPKGDRQHFISSDDVQVLLGRLPAEVCVRLRAVHLNDEGWGVRRLGYVNRGRREIAICALPPRVSLTRFLARPRTPRLFGAQRGSQWPVVAIRRFLLYEVFLHELGHLQLVKSDAKSHRRQYAAEKLAQDFAEQWCRRLWAERFEHPDPAHQAPSDEELTGINRRRLNTS